MRNFILLGNKEKTLKKALSMFLFLFALLIFNANTALSQCSLVAEDVITAAVDENCEAVITVGAVLDGTMTSCPGGVFTVIITDGLGNVVASGNPAIVPAGWAGQTLTAVVLDNVSGNQSNDCTLYVVDNMIPTLACYEAVTGNVDSLITADPTFNRPATPSTSLSCALSGVATAVYYDVFEFSVDQAANYTFTLQPGVIFPAGGYYMAIYDGPFNPASPCDNIVLDAEGANPFITVPLVNTGQYTLVTSTVVNGETGEYSYLFTATNNGIVYAKKPNCDYDVFCYEDLNTEVIILAFDNCDGNPTVQLMDEIPTENDCTDPAVADDVFRTILRTYLATDVSANQSPLLDVNITVHQIPSSTFLTSIFFPEDLLVTTQNSVACNANYPTNIYGNPDPSYTGAPSMVINGVTTSLLSPDLECHVTATYIDLQYTQNNNCLQQFMRIWEVYEWSCQYPNNFTFPPNIQTIEIADTFDPVMVCPDNVEVYTNTSGTFDNTSFGTVTCGALYEFPVPVVTDVCQTNLEWDISVVNDSNFPVIFLNNASMTNPPSYELPLGVNTVTYRIYDGCGNSTECSFTVTVVDIIPPVAICQQYTVVALTYDGEAEVPATSFNSGSYDDCQFDRVEVRRMELGPEFYDFITFNCTDIGTPQTVVMRAYDIFGNWSECMVSVEVQDKLNPTINCPDDMVFDCDYYYEPDNLSAYFGMATAYDNCSVVVTTDSTSNIDQCGEGTITRSFTATDPDGRTASCSQLITFVNNNHFGTDNANNYNPNNSYGDIVWPADNLDIIGCLDPNNFSSVSPLHPNQSGFPVLNEDACDLVGFNYADEIFVINDNELNNVGACFKVIRTWVVKDWCNRVDGVFASWSHDQTLMVNNLEDPTFSRTIPDTSVCTLDSTCVDGYIGMTMTSSDSCTQDSDMKWQYKIDYDNDNAVGVYDYISPIYNGNQLDASGTYTIGTHRILWTIWDQCGNSAAQEHLFTIQNCKKPTPICLVGLATDLTDSDQGPTAVINASYYNDNSYHTCGYDLAFSYTSDINDTLRTYTCSDLGLNPVEMWVTAFLPDGSVTQDYCITEIEIQDNFNICPPLLPSIVVSGTIMDENHNKVPGITVALEGSEFVDQVTDQYGSYAFPKLVAGGDFKLIPMLDTDHNNGVSTLDLIHFQKHLLGIKIIDSPFKMIAADVNRDQKISASDIVSTRKLILGVSETFLNNTSWRFIKTDYVFENEANPLTEAYPEFDIFTDIQKDQNTNFYAIKIGDITRDAQLPGMAQIETRNLKTLKLDMDTEAFTEGDQIEIPVYADQFNQINGFQFTLGFDANMMEFATIESGALHINAQNFYAGAAKSGKVTVSWSKAIAIDVADNTVLFTLRFEAKADSELHEAIFLNSAITKAEAYDADLDKMNLELNFRNLELENNYALYQNTPNPFSENTVIRFNMKEAGTASITIYDIQGKVLKTYESNFEKGLHEISISNEDLPANGIMYYQMNTDGFNATKKMILVK